MSYLQALILSAVEGLSEFLPISSTAHLTLTSYLLGLSQTHFVKTFEISIQSGTIVAALVYYRTHLTQDKAIHPKIALALLPSLIVGGLFYHFIKSYLIGNLWVTLTALGLGGGVLLVISPRAHPNSSPTYLQAIVIGLFQALAVIPGVSRSASSITGGLLVGLSQFAATEFAFLLAIPTLFAATSLDLYSSLDKFSRSDTALLSIGFVGSAVTGFFAIKYFLKYIERHSLRAFGLYRVLLALYILFSLTRSA